MNEVPEVEIAALCDVVPHKMDQRAELIGKGPQPQKYTDMEKMLQQDYACGPSTADCFFTVNGTIKLGEGQLEITYGHARGFPTQEPLPKPVKMKLSGGDGTTDQWKYFARVLAGQADPYPDGHTGRQSIQICQGAIVSPQEKRVVNVSELA